MSAQWNRGGSANTRIPLNRTGVLYAIHACRAAKPIVAIKGHPEPGLKIVAEMSLERRNRALRLSVRARRELVVREELEVRGVEPCSSVGIQNPMTPATRIAKLRFEGPAVGAEIYEFRRVVLACLRHEPETDAQDSLLLPVHEFGHTHRTTPYQVHRESESDWQESRTVAESLRAQGRAPEGPNTIGQ